MLLLLLPPLSLPPLLLLMLLRDMLLPLLPLRPRRDHGLGAEVQLPWVSSSLASCHGGLRGKGS